MVAADRLLFAMEPFALNEIHLVVDFESAPDPAPLAVALRRLLDLEPILGCRLVTGFWGARWERLPAATLDAFSLERGGDEAAFLTRLRDPHTGPQLQALDMSGVSRTPSGSAQRRASPDERHAVRTRPLVRCLLIPDG